MRILVPVSVNKLAFPGCGSLEPAVPAYYNDRAVSHVERLPSGLEDQPMVAANDITRPGEKRGP